MWLRNPICNEKSSVRIVRDSLSLSMLPSLFVSLSLSLYRLRIYIAAYFQAYLWHALTSERAKIMQYNYGKPRIWPLLIRRPPARVSLSLLCFVCSSG